MRRASTSTGCSTAHAGIPMGNPRPEFVARPLPPNKPTTTTPPHPHPPPSCCSTVQGTAVGVLGVRSQSVVFLVQDLRPCLVSREEKLAWHVVVRWFFVCQEAIADDGGACLPRALSSGEGGGRRGKLFNIGHAEWRRRITPHSHASSHAGVVRPPGQPGHPFAAPGPAGHNNQNDTAYATNLDLRAIQRRFTSPALIDAYWGSDALATELVSGRLLGSQQTAAAT